jgi:DNA (cytosine-5)-methyltransferase 1
VISEDWPARSKSVWGNAGLMVGGVALTATVQPDFEGGRLALGDVLLPIERIMTDYAEYIIPGSQLDWSEKPRTSSWNYLKGAKREERTKRVEGQTFNYFYTEGAVRFPEPPTEPSRTVLTGEGGTSPSRFKHVVAQDVPDALLDDESLSVQARDELADDETGRAVVYRRLTPPELERLNGFEDGWTEGMSDGRRAFCMGNALVVGVVAEIGAEIARRRSAS